MKKVEHIGDADTQAIIWIHDSVKYAFGVQRDMVYIEIDDGKEDSGAIAFGFPLVHAIEALNRAALAAA